MACKICPPMRPSLPPSLLFSLPLSLLSSLLPSLYVQAPSRSLTSRLSPASLNYSLPSTLNSSVFLYFPQVYLRISLLASSPLLCPFLAALPATRHLPPLLLLRVFPRFLRPKSDALPTHLSLPLTTVYLPTSLP